MKQIILGTIMWHPQNNVVIGPRQNGFRNGRYCLTNLMSLYDKVMHLTDERKAMDVIYLDLVKPSDTISHIILLKRLDAHSLDRCTLCWLGN